MRTNHLISEKSPYLLQHAHNPVHWFPWGKEAFDRAKLEEKPVLLSVGYSTCHWCHVMAHESFEDDGIARMINENFIAIKVDREERPDIDHIYMTAVTSMTGQGGWPLTVFLTPQGEPFYGGTYFPPYAKWGSVGFIDLLGSIATAWKTDRANILSASHSMTAGLQRRLENDETIPEKMGEPLLNNAYRQMRGQYDPINGGFGSAPKFPMGHNLSFLLRYYKRSSSTEALDMVKGTLTAMANGGIWDHLGGGFHRYSTDQKWHVPHFEKMLYDQALLSRAYLEAFQVTATQDYARIAREILNYVQTDMADPLGGFYCAEDADSQGVEGAFYVFSFSEIEESLGQDQAHIFNFCYGVSPEGNVEIDPHGEFREKNIFYQAHGSKEAAAKFHKPENEIQDILKESKIKLLAIRNKRPRPYKDNKVLCDWNGLMIASFAFASRVLEEPGYARVAMKAADFILDSMTQKGRLLHRWRDGEAGITATLDDYSFFIYGLLELYEATFQDKYLDAAQRFTDGMIEFFGDKAGGFYMTASDAEALIIRPQEVYDGALPSGNSAAALILLKLSALTGKDVYDLQAKALFANFAPRVAQAPYAHSFLLSALDWHLQSPLEITFHGAGDDSTVAKMLKVLYKHFIPHKAIRHVLAAGQGQAYLCFRGMCKAPIGSVNIFEKEILTEAKL